MTLGRWKRLFGRAPPPTEPRRASTDALTGLSSRAAMHDALEVALRAGVQGVAVLLDLDNFRYFNDRHGRQDGDELLRVTAARLREAFPTAACVARVGGGRFMVFLPGMTLAAASRLAQACIETLREPVRLAGGAEIVTASAGVATLDGQAGRPVEAVWRACAIALQAARARGRDRAVAFDDDTRQVLAPRRGLALTVRELQTRQRARREQARTDALTGLRSRLALDELLHAADGEGDRRAPRAALAFVDVDHFGDYQHAQGDAAGDEALRAVAHAIRANAREGDCVFRKGGEEFVVVLPDVRDAADSADASAACERIRQAVQALALPNPASSVADVVTVTIGVASGPPGCTLRQLLGAAAEQAMAAKVSGQRNRVHAVRLRDVGPAG